MFEDLTLIAGVFFDTMTQIFNLYTGSAILSGVLALWLLRKVVDIYRHIKSRRSDFAKYHNFPVQLPG